MRRLMCLSTADLQTQQTNLPDPLLETHCHMHHCSRLKEFAKLMQIQLVCMLAQDDGNSAYCY